MEVTVKLFAALSRYLPPGAAANAARVEVEESTDPLGVIRRLGIPAEQCHLVLVNGSYVPPSERTGCRLGAGDVIAIWPPVAGG